MSADAPIASLIKKASTEKDAIFPVHPGAKVYYDGEETTLMERYGDWLFYGPMLFGVVGSALLGLRRFLQADTARPSLLPQFGLVLSTIKEARNLSELERVRADLDTDVERLLKAALVGASDQERAAITAMALGYLNLALIERRQFLQTQKIESLGVGEVTRDAAALNRTPC